MYSWFLQVALEDHCVLELYKGHELVFVGLIGSCPGWRERLTQEQMRL